MVYLKLFIVHFIQAFVVFYLGYYYCKNRKSGRRSYHGPMYRNKKNGNLYRVHAFNATNKTNASDDQCMVVYTDYSGDTYVRERLEFHEKFTRHI